MLPDSTGNDELPLLVISATGGWRALDVREMWTYRDLFRALVVRDIKLRYRQTALGVGWVVIQPLLGAGVLTVVFGSIAQLPSNGFPYFLLALVGTSGWSFFSGLLTKSSGSLLNNSSLLTKVFFPRAMLPLSTVGSSALDLAVSLTMVVITASLYGYPPDLHILALVPAVLTLTFLAIGPGFLLSAALVSYRDVAQILPVATQLFLYISPVAYAVSVVPQHLRQWFDLNPLVAPLEGMRWAVLGEGSVSTTALLSSAVATTVFLVVGSMVFRHFEQRFADVI